MLGNFNAMVDHISDGILYVLDGVEPGTVSVPDTAVATIAGNDDVMLVGMSTAIIDADADGFNDLLVGVPGAPLEGAAALFLGPVNGYYNYDEGDVTIWGEVEYGLAGEGVHNLGDANDDGVDDMLITDPQARNGAAYVVWGGGTLPTTLADADLTFRNSDSSRIFGSFSAALGDLNGDGAVDFYIAESGDRPCANHLFFGPFDTAGVYAETDHAVLLRTTGDSECYVETALNIGDQSGDGANDLLIGSPLHTVGSTSAAGIAYIIPGYGW